jgi:ribosomal protein S18 acetylase RimI-like enzyme
MPYNWTTTEAQTSDAGAIVSIFALSWTSPFARLQYGHIDSSTFAEAMTRRTADQILQPNMRFIIVRSPETHEVISVAHWSLPVDETMETVNKESQEESEERQMFEDELYKKSLPEGSNIDLVMEFTIGLRNLRKEVLQGRPHFHLENLATHPAYRGKSLASTTIEWALTQADEQNVLVYLETASDNKAARMYKRLGFEEQGRFVIKDVSRFADKEERSTYSGSTDHTHVAYLRYPQKNS